jgi:hypothetical protein
MVVLWRLSTKLKCESIVVACFFQCNQRRFWDNFKISKSKLPRGLWSREFRAWYRSSKSSFQRTSEITPMNFLSSYPELTTPNMSLYDTNHAFRLKTSMDMWCGNPHKCRFACHTTSVSRLTCYTLGVILAVISPLPKRAWKLDTMCKAHRNGSRLPRYYHFLMLTPNAYSLMLISNAYSLMLTF